MAVTIGTEVWKGICAAVHMLAIALTIIRLAEKYRRRRMWWDDLAIFFSVLLSMGYLSIVWLQNEPQDLFLVRGGGEQTKIIVFWFAILFFPSVVWTARLSLVFGIIHIVPERSIRDRKILYVMTCCFVLAWFLLVAQSLWLCAESPVWEAVPQGQCVFGSMVGGLILLTDILADLGLILFPLHLLHKTSLPESEHRLFRLLFLSSLGSSIFGVLYAALIFNKQQLGTSCALWISLAANVKAAVTLIVCNALVVGTYCYRVFRGRNIKSALRVSPSWDADAGIETVPVLSTGKENCADTESGQESGADKALESDAVSETDTYMSWNTLETTATFDPTLRPQYIRTVLTAAFLDLIHPSSTQDDLPLSRSRNLYALGIQMESNGAITPLAPHNTSLSVAVPNYSGITPPPRVHTRGQPVRLYQSTEW